MTALRKDMPGVRTCAALPAPTALPAPGVLASLHQPADPPPPPLHPPPHPHPPRTTHVGRWGSPRRSARPGRAASRQRNRTSPRQSKRGGAQTRRRRRPSPLWRCAPNTLHRSYSPLQGATRTRHMSRGRAIGSAQNEPPKTGSQIAPSWGINVLQCVHQATQNMQ